MVILGISAFYHDSAACLVKDGEIIAAAQEERFTRKKHDSSFPEHAIAFCLNYAGISPDEIDYVAFYDKPFVKFDRILHTYLQTAPAGWKSFLMSIPLWLKKKFWMKEELVKAFPNARAILFPEHHLSHAASAFFPSPFEEAAIVTIDGVGEWTTNAIGMGKGNQIDLIRDIRFPHSLGLLYSAFTYYLGFKVNSGEYKVMGLAPYGEPVYVKDIYHHLIDLKEDGSYFLNMNYFNYLAGLTMTSEKFHRLFGQPPRKEGDPLTQFHMDLARSLQEVTEEIMLRQARYAKEETGARFLTLAGGVALNCVGNGKILRSGLFDDIWIQPAAGDAGGAVGAALATWYMYLENARNPLPGDSMKGALLGPEFSDQDIEQFLNNHQIPFEKFSDEEELIEKAVELIEKQNVVGWFQGRMEFGPRALGCRSILGDARNPEMQKKMNLKIKYRESFRPFAPSVLAEHVSEWFELDRPSPYMLLVANVHPSKRKPIHDEDKKKTGLDKLKIYRSEIPAVTHVDYSARIQTVHRNTNPRYYKLLQKFHEKTGVPVMINTSFNVRGEPIVCTPEEAYNCFMRTEMDYLIMGSFVLSKQEQLKHQKSALKVEQFELD